MAHAPPGTARLTEEREPQTARIPRNSSSHVSAVSLLKPGENFSPASAGKTGRRRESDALRTRGSGQEHAELEDDSATTDATAGREFDKQWALAIMEGALQKVSAECMAKRGEGAFEVISVFIGGKGEVRPLEKAAEKLGMAVGLFRTEIFTWRQKLREYLRAEVRRTVSAPHEVERR